MSTFYLTQQHRFLTDPHCSDRELKLVLKEKFGFNARRMSRLTLLALIGALEFKPERSTGVYLSSSFTSPSSMHALLMKTYESKSSHPFGFMNCIHNAVPFYIAQALKLEGPNIFLSSNPMSRSWSQPILLALNDLNKNRVESALIGWVHEHKKFKESSSKEGSHFISISKNATPATHQICSITPSGNLPTQTTNDSDNYFYSEVDHFIDHLALAQPYTLTTLFNPLQFKPIKNS